MNATGLVTLPACHNPPLAICGRRIEHTVCQCERGRGRHCHPHYHTSNQKIQCRVRYTGRTSLQDSQERRNPGTQRQDAAAEDFKSRTTHGSHAVNPAKQKCKSHQTTRGSIITPIEQHLSAVHCTLLGHVIADVNGRHSAISPQ